MITLTNPYNNVTKEIGKILQDLMQRMIKENDTKVFRNIAAIYIMWQQDLHFCELEGLNWQIENNKRLL